MKFGTFDDFDHIAKHGLAPIDDALFVAAIDKNFEEMGQNEKKADQHQMGATGFRNARRVNNDRQRPALRINRYMAFAAFRFLATIVTALPPFCTVLTDWRSTIASVGSGLRPAFTRTRRRSSCMIRSHNPLFRQRQNVMYTTSHGGKSFGNKRHWHPVRCT